MDVFEQLRAIPREILRKYANRADSYSFALGWTARQIGDITRFENGARFVEMRTENARAYIPLFLADTAQEKDAALLGLLSPKDRIGILQRLAGGSADMNGRFYPLRRDGGKTHIIDGDYGTTIGTVERDALQDWARKITIEDVPEAVLTAACSDSVPDELLVDPIHNERAWNGWLLEVGKDRVSVRSPQNTRIETTLEELDALRRERARAKVSTGSLQTDADPKPEASAPEAATSLDAAVPQALKEYAAHLVRGYVPPSVYHQLPDGWSLLNGPVGARAVTCKGPDGIVASFNLDDVPVAYALEDLPPDVAIAAQKLAYGLMGGEPTSPRWSLMRNGCGEVEVQTPSGDMVPISGEIPPPDVSLDDIHPAALKYARDLCAEALGGEAVAACLASGWEATILTNKRVAFRTSNGRQVVLDEEFVLRGAAPPVASGESVASMPDMATKKIASKPGAKRPVQLGDIDANAIRRALELIVGDTTDPVQTDWSVALDGDDVLFTSPAGEFGKFGKAAIEERHREIYEHAYDLSIDDVPMHAVRRALQLLVDWEAAESTWSVHVATPDSVVITAKDMRMGRFSGSQICSRYYDLWGASSLYFAYQKKNAQPKADTVHGGSIVIGKHNTKESSMSEIVKTIRRDITEASWRTAGSQFVKLAREPLVGLLARHLGPDDESMRARVASFLETELGTAMLAGLLSAGVGMVPGTGSVAERLSQELRVRAMADAGDVVADVLMGPLRQVMAMYLHDGDGGNLVVTSAPAHLAEGAPHIAAVPSVPAAERTR